MRKILAPHEEQDGGVYLRALRVKVTDAEKGAHPEYVEGDDYYLPTRSGRGTVVSYQDALPGARTISSRRVERAVETDDYLRLCAEEGLVVNVHPYGFFTVSGGKPSKYHTRKGCNSPSFINGDIAWGATLREAYHRYHAGCDARE